MLADLRPLARPVLAPRSASLITYIARRVRRFGLTLGIMLAFSSVWFFAEADLNTCVDEGLYEYTPYSVDFVTPYSLDFQDYPIARRYLGVTECWRTDLATDLERIITGREHPPFQRVTSGLAQVPRDVVIAIPTEVLWAVLVGCLAVLGGDWLQRRRANS